ncbi:MAG: hypothetical protein KDA96_02210 [Planctomycetaceae bacterium]|nr:hypothetical protein [Planctomycetaceae bacterium]
MADETSFDLRFRMFGIPVRVHPIFWISAIVLMWNPDAPQQVISGVIACFACVLVHELGHAVMFRRYGWHSNIVLYILGGYATGGRLPTGRDIAVSMAGPIAGMSLLIPLVIVFRLLIHFSPGTLIAYPMILIFLNQVAFFALLVNLMNLVPCMPFDGGRVMQALVLHYRMGGPLRVLEISIASSALVALWGLACHLKNRDVLPVGRLLASLELPESLLFVYGIEGRMLAILFGIFCVQQIVAYQNWRY